MKSLVLLIVSLVAPVAFGQTTNNINVTLTSAQDAALKAAWVFDTTLRTNGIAPYTNVVAAQTFRQFVETVAADAIAEKVQQIAVGRERDMSDRWRNATPTKQKAALQALQ